MPRKSVATPCKGDTERETQKPAAEEKSKRLRSRSAGSSSSCSTSKRAKRSPSALSRSPVLTRSRSRQLGQSSMESAEDNLKRKHSNNPDKDHKFTGEGSSREAKKQKPDKASMSNQTSQKGNRKSDAPPASTSKEEATPKKPEEASGTSSRLYVSKRKDKSKCRFLEEPSAEEDLSNYPQPGGSQTLHGNEIEIVAMRRDRVACARKDRDCPERQLITKSEFQRSLLSVMQRARSAQSQNTNKNSDSPSSDSGNAEASAYSDFPGVVRIKIEKDDEVPREQCKYSKSAAAVAREGSPANQNIFKPPASSSNNAAANGNTFHNIAIKQEVESSGEDMNSFVSRRILIPENIDAESSAGLNIASNSAAIGSSESIEGEISRLQALMDTRRIPLSLFGALESRMHQLFQKQMGTSASSRAQQLLQQLQSAEDDEQQLQVLVEMSQLLVMGNEDTLIGFPVKQLVPILINLLLKEYNFELMNQACRALTYLMEALPRSSTVITEAIPVLLNKVQVIQCIDVAEQALTALKMLSKWHSKQILQAKGISACLMYLEFFSINAQRTALAIIANCCQNILPHEFTMVQESLPQLSGWLTHQDEKSVESICLAFSGLVECFHSDPASLMLIGSNSLLSNVQQLLIVTPPILSSQVFTSVVHMLATMCSACSDIAVFLLKQNFSETLHCLLVGSATDATKSLDLAPRSPHEFLELSSLMCEMMPQLPSDPLFAIESMIMEARQKASAHGTVVWQWKDETGHWHSHEKNDSRVMEEAYQRGNWKLYISDRASINVDLQAMEQFDEEGTSNPRPIRRHVLSAAEKCAKIVRADFFKDNEELVYASIKTLFPVLFEMFCSSAGSNVKNRCLKGMLRMVYFAPPDVLRTVLKSQSISRQIASMLACHEYRFVICALLIAEMLMRKLPTEFRVHFIREGVLHEVKNLTEIDIKTWLIQAIDDISPVASTSSPISQPSTSDSGELKVEAIQSPNIFPASIFEKSPHQSLKEEDNSLNVASKIRDALKRRYMNIKRTFGGSDKELSALCCADVGIPIDARVKSNTWVKEQAQSFVEKYFNTDLINSHPVINVLNNLTNAVKALEGAGNCGLKPLKEIRDVVTMNDISSFELIHSGLVNKLKLYLSAPPGEVNFGNATLEDRLRTFLNVFVGSPRSINGPMPEVLNAEPLSNLVTKLNACVSHLEQFPVKVIDQPYNGNAGRPGASIMKFFNMHQLKCLFQRHPACSNLRQWRSGAVMIDPLASIQNVDRYLVSQGYGTVKEDDESESDLSYDDSSDDDGTLMVVDIRNDHGHGTPKLQFLIGKNVLPYNMTLYQAVRQYASGDGPSTAAENENPVGYGSVWLRTHTIWYRPIPPEEVAETADPSVIQAKKKHSSSRSSHGSKSSSSEKSKSAKAKKDTVWDSGTVPEAVFPSTFSSKMAGFEAIKDPSLDVIHLLCAVHGLSYHWGLLYRKNSWAPIVLQNVFINNELTLKVNRQLQDPLAIMTGNVPSWVSHIAYNFPFLFPFETRHLLFYITSFDRERALQRLLDTAPELTNTEKMTPRLEKRKRTVSRSSILKQAEIILQDHGDSKALLEIQYKNEVGTGLGPTLEFYALVSKELQRSDLEMWHVVNTVTEKDKEANVSYVHSPSGLFPLPLSRSIRGTSLAKVCCKFKLLGKFLAKAIMDSRLVDIPLSLIFYKWMLNQDTLLSLADLQHVDESLSQNIIKLEQIVVQKKKVENDRAMDVESLKKSLENITLDGCAIEDLQLDFTLPGYSKIELKRGGKGVNVSIHNLEDYLKLLKYWTLSEGVSRQMKAFKEGFDSVFSMSRLQVFYPEELAYLFCGNVQNQWDAKSLSESCKPDHGYTHDSPAIKFLFEILSNYDSQEQRQFVQFVTGSPRLPIGGFKSLTPPLTIVRKSSDNDTSSDNYLPSVMTCVNYLKLPDYSSVEKMREKLAVAISEGQHSFHLS